MPPEDKDKIVPVHSGFDLFTPSKNKRVLTEEAFDAFAQSIQNASPIQPIQYSTSAVETRKLGDLSGISARESITTHVGKEMALKMEQELFDSLRNITNGHITPASQVALPDIETVINRTPDDIILRLLAKKSARVIKSHDMKRILDYFYRNTTTIFKEDLKATFTEKLNPDNFMDQMKTALERLSGVKATIMDNNYPESASIIIKVDMKALDEVETECISSNIYTTIKNYKLDGLDELEVIYHNKEVY